MGRGLKSSNKKEPKKLYGEYKKIQDIYTNCGVRSTEFYLQVVAYIKRLLNKYLKQKQFSEDHINDCFIAIYKRVGESYDPNKGCLGTFVHTIVRNYCTKVNYRLINHQSPVSLDFEYINKDDLLLGDSCFDDLDYLDDYSLSGEKDSVENHCSELRLDEQLEVIERCYDLKSHLDSISKEENIDDISSIDASRKDLLWNLWLKIEKI